MHPRSLFLTAIVLPLLAIGVALAPDTLASSPAAPAADDAALLRELAQRLLTPLYAPPGAQPATVRLLPGALPPDLPFTLPVPPGARVVGSAVHEGDPKFGQRGDDVVLDGGMSAADVVAFYQHQLPTIGFASPPNAGQPRGFQATAQPLNAAFCRTGGGWLMLNALPTGDAGSDVRFHFDASNPGPCGAIGPMGGKQMPPGFELLPLLPAPHGVAVQIMPGGGGIGRFGSEAQATTPMSVAELEAAYARDLVAAGWTREAGAASGPLAWSTWTLPAAGDWHGFLSVLQAPGTDKRDLTLRIESATVDPSGMRK